MLTTRLSPLLCSCAVLTAPLTAQEPRHQPPTFPTIAAKTASLERRDGFVPIVLDQRAGTMWLELPKAGTRLLLCTTLATGLDRGTTGRCFAARFEPSGPAQLVVLENWSYRSTLPDNAVAGYAVVSATVGLRRPVPLGANLAVAGFLTVSNLFDRRYVASAYLNPDVVDGVPVAFEPGLPRRLLVSISLSRGGAGGRYDQRQTR